MARASTESLPIIATSLRAFIWDLLTTPYGDALQIHLAQGDITRQDSCQPILDKLQRTRRVIIL